MTVIPGEKIGNALEYLPGAGAYSEKDGVYASNIGTPELDAAKRTAQLKIITKIPKFEGVGTITLGKAANVTDKFAMIDLIPFETKDFRFIPQQITAVLRVSEVKRGFVESLTDEVKTGDILRVKIIDVTKSTVTLTINERDLGVVKAYCSQCRKPMERQGYKLMCPSGHTEERKMAPDYGNCEV